MECSATGPTAQGLARYVGEVAEQLEHAVVLCDSEIAYGLAHALIAVQAHVPTLAEYWHLLSWDEVNGWALRVTLNNTGDSTAVAYLDGDILPPARAVAEFLTRATHGEHPGTVSPPALREPGDPDLVRRLAALAED